LGVLPNATDFLYVDPHNEVYDALDLNRGVGTTFFSPAIPWTFGNRLLNGEPMFSTELMNVLGKWKDAVYIPPKQEQAFFQGGAFVFSSKTGDTVYAHYDEATAAHAPPNEMVAKALEVASASASSSSAAAAAASSSAAAVADPIVRE